MTSGWASIVIGIGFAFVLAPLTVRTLGNVHYGIWTLLMQITGYLWLFDFGVRESVVKYVAQYHAADDRPGIETTVRTAVSIYSVVSLATLACAALLALALPYLFNIPAGGGDRPRASRRSGRRHGRAELRVQRLRRRRDGTRRSSIWSPGSASSSPWSAAC